MREHGRRWPCPLVIRTRSSPWLPVALTAFLGGVVTGGLVWGGLLARSRRDLFSPSPLRRLAALGYLAGRPGAGSARVVAEYLAWEQNPLLRRRARHLLSRLAHHLE